MSKSIVMPEAMTTMPQLVVAQPLNDVALIALIAARLYSQYDSTRGTVTRACELIAESVLAVQRGDLSRIIKERIPKTE